MAQNNSINNRSSTLVVDNILTVTAGNITASAGDIVITAGNITLPFSNAAGTQGTILINGNLALNTLGTGNFFMGIGAGNLTFNTGLASANVGYGLSVLSSLTDGSSNTAIGYNNSTLITTGGSNTALGPSALGFLVSGSSNIAVGSAAGRNFTGAESNNIDIGHLGVLGESGVTRIGTNGNQTSFYAAGIDGVNVGSVSKVVTMASDQLGTATVTAGAGISVTPGANTITIAATGSNSALPAFVATLSSSVANVTGDGTDYTVAFNATLVNQGSSFNTGTGAFTAPVTGLYSFNVNLYIQNVVAADTIGYAYFDINSGSLQYFFIDSNFANCADANGNFSVNASSDLPLTAGDVITVHFAVIGVLKTIGLAGAAASSGTRFSGYLVA